MTLKEFSLAVKKEYQKKAGERFFTEKALLSALLEKNGFDRNAAILHPETELLPETEKQIFADFDRLLAGEPIQYYLGTEFFCGEEFSVLPGVLIPRPETELLVEIGTSLAPENALVFDLCCGSGCIGISLLLKREDLSARLFDLSPEALLLSEKNIRSFGLESRAGIEKADVLSEKMEVIVRNGKPDLILSNPPYLTAREMEKIEENVRREPAMALYGGEDGLLFYRALIDLSQKTGVPILCEIGAGQKKQIEKILAEKGFSYEFFTDFSALDRAFFAKPKKS